MMDRHFDPWPVNYAIWSMGNRSGVQEINVYLPRAPRQVLLLTYEVYTASGTSSRQIQVRPDEEAGWIDLGTFFGDGSEITVVLDDTRAGYVDLELAPREAVVDIDAVRIRCVALCDTTRTPPLPVSELVVRSSPSHSGSYARWPAASGANLYEVEARRAGQADNSYSFYAHCCVYEFHRFGSLDGPVDAIRVRHIEAFDFISREEALERGYLVGSALHELWVGTIGAGPWSDWVEIPEGVPLDGGAPDGTPETSEDDPDRVPPGETPLTSVDPTPEGTPTVPTEETEEPSVVVTEVTPTLSVLGRVSGLYYDSGSERAVWQPVPGARSYLLAMWDGEQSQILNVECCSYIIYLSQNHVEQINVRASNNSVNDPVYGPWTGWVSLPDPSIATAQDVGELILPQKPQRPVRPTLTTLKWHSSGDSYSSGTGAEPYYDDSFGCKRSDKAYGHVASGLLRERGWRIGSDWGDEEITHSGIGFSACSGHHVEEFFFTHFHDGVYHDSLSIGRAVDVMTMSMGGNDIGFDTLLEEIADCALPSWRILFGRIPKVCEEFAYLPHEWFDGVENSLRTRAYNLMNTPDKVNCFQMLRYHQELPYRYRCDLAIRPRNEGTWVITS